MKISNPHAVVSTQRLVIDPPNCGCTECLIGEYIPFDQIQAMHIRQLLNGTAVDHSEVDFTLEVDDEVSYSDTVSVVQLRLHYIEPGFWGNPPHPASVKCYVIGVCEADLDPDSAVATLLGHLFLDYTEMCNAAEMRD